MKIFRKFLSVCRQFCLQHKVSNNIFSWDISSNVAKSRILLVIIGFIICFLVIIYRLVTIASNNYVRTIIEENVTSFRKEIVDRNGKVLAINIPSSSYFANPARIINIEDAVSKILATIPDIDREKLISGLKSGKSFVWVKRDLSPTEKAKLFNLGLAGFDFKDEERRIYTFGNLFSHIIGYVGRDFTGLAGLEQSYNKFLTNDPAEVKKEDFNKPLELTLDIRLQGILNEELDKTISEFKAKGGVGIIIDPNNGEILAMVSKPDFNPHYPNKATSEQLFNRASLGIYEIGSVFKALTMAIGFETKMITMHDLYDITYMKVGKFQIKDYHKKQGWHSVPEIFVHSSNIGTSQIMLEIGKDNFKKYLKELGLLDQLQLELPERGTPLFPSDSRWNELTSATMSYGYAMSASPLHFVQAMIPVINGGYFYPITLIKKQNNHDNVRQVFNNETSIEIRKLLRLVVEKGGGKKADVKGYFVGGKTGTANKLSGGKYLQNSRISSFFAVMPASDPKYAIYIMIDDPKASESSHGFATGSWVAAPAVGKIFEKIIALYGIQPMDESSPEVQNIINVDYKVDDEI